MSSEILRCGLRRGVAREDRQSKCAVGFRSVLPKLTLFRGGWIELVRSRKGVESVGFGCTSCMRF